MVQSDLPATPSSGLSASVGLVPSDRAGAHRAQALRFPPNPSGLRVVVLISGGGSNLAALLAAQGSAEFGAMVVAVGADRHSAAGLQLAQDAGVPTFVHRVDDYPDRESWDLALTAQAACYEPGLVVSAGFLKLVGAHFLKRFSGRYINTHNALLPAFPGMHGPAEALAYGVKVAGATLFVVDAGVDSGPIVAQVAVPVHEDDSEQSLTERIKQAERAQLVEQVSLMARHGWTIQGRRVSIP
jgi:phosphoribosylglycinamide formyltransferase-1